MFKKIIENRKGTALLVALLVMGVLIAISLALSTLVIREIRLTKGVLDAGRAYYSAESAIEVALYKLNHELPGWETPQKQYQPLKINEENSAVAEFRVDNTCNSYPCLDEEFDPDSVGEDLYVFYDVLDLNESINIPLFVVDEDGQEVPVGDFRVQFFAPFKPAAHFSDEVKNALQGKISSWDVLRWKVFGINSQNNNTESISDFTALSDLNEADEANSDSFLTNAAAPSWFGSVTCAAQQGNIAGINCAPYSTNTSEEISGYGGQKASFFVGSCLVTEAREHYVYVNEKVENIVDCYPIKNFLQNHDLNYLSLTNLMNPGVFKPGVDKQALSRLYFRVELFADSANPESGDKTVREFANITANGYSGESKQSINVKIQRGSFMPVFHFSLYSTYTGGEGYDYYYEEE